MIKFLLWCLLFVLCWPLALFALGALGLALTINDPPDYSLGNSVAYLVWCLSMLLTAVFALILAFKNFRSKQTRSIV